MLKKRNAVIVGLTSITLFTGCIAFINSSDNQNKVIAEAFNQPRPKLSAEAAPSGQGGTTLLPPVPMTTNAETVPTPELPTEQPSAVTPDIKNNVTQMPTDSISVIAPTSSQTPSPTIKVTPPTTTSTQSIKVVPPTTPKTTTTKTRAS